jgi:hypothetical protein
VHGVALGSIESGLDTMDRKNPVGYAIWVSGDIPMRQMNGIWHTVISNCEKSGLLGG